MRPGIGRRCFGFRVTKGAAAWMAAVPIKRSIVATGLPRRWI